MSLFWGKAALDATLWGKHEGDGRTLGPAQSALSGFGAACIGPLLSGPLDVTKTCLMAAGGPEYRVRYVVFWVVCCMAWGVVDCY